MEHSKFAKTTLVLAIAMFFSAPYIALAQEAADTQTTATQAANAVAPQASEPSASAEAAAQANPATTDVPTTGEVVQDTANTQQTAGSDLLEGTTNPETDVPTEASSTVAVVTATSSDAQAADVIQIQDAPPGLAPDEVPLPAQSDLTVVTSDVKSETADGIPLSNAELNQMIEPDFVMQLSGKTIATEQKDAKTGKLIPVTAQANTIVDPDSKAITVSGVCSSPYFVVLLFKNQGDYEADPHSYILNKAFPCTNGEYSYSIADLPASLQNGTYYVLIGEQGDSGPWKPVTSLTEITINRQ